MQMEKQHPFDNAMEFIVLLHIYVFFEIEKLQLLILGARIHSFKKSLSLSIIKKGIYKNWEPLFQWEYR